MVVILWSHIACLLELWWKISEDSQGFSLMDQTLTCRESLVKFIDTCPTHQKFLGVLIDLVTNGPSMQLPFLFGNPAYRAWHFDGSAPFQNTSNLCRIWSTTGAGYMHSSYGQGSLVFPPKIFKDCLNICQRYSYRCDLHWFHLSDCIWRTCPADPLRHAMHSSCMQNCQYLLIQHRDHFLGDHQPHGHPSTLVSNDHLFWQQTDGGGWWDW